MKVFIIEDEVLAREELIRMLLKHFPDTDIAGTAGSVRESAQWLRRNTVDLIFMDIQLSDGSCFDIFGIVDIRTPVIFTTAYDSYALKAFKMNSVDYLLKPLDEGELVSAVRKADCRYGRIRELIETFFPPKPRYKTRISVRLGETYGFLPIGSVAYFISDGGLTFAVTDAGDRHMVDYTIESLSPLLDPELFFKVARGCIVSIDSIGTVSKYFGGRLKLQLKDRRELVLSRARVPAFLEWMDGR